MTEDFEPQIPAYYTVSPKLTDEQVARVEHALQITPIYAVIITDYHDSQLAAKFHTNVLFTTAEKMFDLAKRIDEPVVILTGDAELHAYYSDEETEVQEDGCSTTHTS